MASLGTLDFAVSIDPKVLEHVQIDYPIVLLIHLNLPLALLR